MGCATSKLDDSPAVALCRHRCSSLDEALRLRFSFADSHAAYLSSLSSLGVSLHRFFLHDDSASPPSPLLNLPPSRKGESKIERNSSSDSGSHLQFDSDSDEEAAPLHNRDDRDASFGDGGGFANLNYMKTQATPSVAHTHLPIRPETVQMNHSNRISDGFSNYGGGGGFVNLNFMKNQTTPSVAHTHLPVSSETVQMNHSNRISDGFSNYGVGGGFSGDFSSPSDEESAPLHNRDVNFGEGGFVNMNYMRNQTTPSVVHTHLPISSETVQMNYSNRISDGYSNYGGGGGFYGDFSSPAAAKEAPPPPSPPRSSTWDFLNPFETVEKFYPAYDSSHDSREVREEEGIPDLEEDDDDDEGEVVKKGVNGDDHHKLADGGRNSYSKSKSQENDVDSKQNVKKKSEESSRNGGFKDDLDVLREIQIQFEKASQCGNELSKFLEVGKLPYKQKQVSSKILHLTAASFQPSLSIASDSASSDPAFFDVLQDVELKSKTLSSVMHKLYLWEKKLYEEVKVEEKMRVVHERKSKKMKHMDERGSESHKVEAARTMVRSLSTKIKIAIQVVDKISMKINRLRDEELWPQLHDFIQGLTRMWKSMLECHNNQCRAIGEAKRLDAIASQNHFSDAQFEATRQLQHDIVNWTLWFSRWVGALKGYVRALNNWLMKCLLYVPEETPDGPAPFSPGRMGAPAVFVVCNQWAQSLDRVSERDVVESMREFAANVLRVWDRDKAEMRMKMVADRDERKLKGLEREIQLLERKMVVVMPGDGNEARAVYQSETSRGGGLQASLQRVLEAMGKFTSNSLQVYEELLQRVEEERV